MGAFNARRHCRGTLQELVERGGETRSWGAVHNVVIDRHSQSSIFATLSFVDVKTLGWPGRPSACPADGRRGASMVAELAGRACDCVRTAH